MDFEGTVENPLELISNGAPWQMPPEEMKEYWRHNLAQYKRRIILLSEVREMEMATLSFAMLKHIVPKDFLAEISEALFKSANEVTFNSIKNLVISHYCTYVKFKKELEASGKPQPKELPSVVLHRLQERMRLDGDGGKAVHKFWIGTLPKIFAHQMEKFKTWPYKEQAIVADTFFRVAGYARQTEPTETGQPLSLLEKRLDSLAQTLLARGYMPWKRSHRRSSLRARFSPQGLCYYHDKFKERARVCVFGCTYNKEPPKPAEN
ncbi:Hypothetical predicted protein [Cloeon dipterum]|uniref:Uncharacterized protein n=1 Tax=Cloeon dipterum TaxID=197152 RepID=A0A8S1CYX8_9INSE|nr:Hypothetical predicted protein [Cloeon dipterum]